MTTTTEARVADSDQVDGGQRLWRKTLAALVVGLIVGALAGGLYGASRPTTYTATSALSVLPDPTLSTAQQSGTNNSTPTQDATAFIQSELVTLNSAQLADGVQRTLRLSSTPDVASTQVGQTYVVQITANEPTRAEAVSVATATGNAYRAIRVGQLTNEVQTQLASTNAQLSTVSASLSSSTSRNTGALTPSQSAIQTEYERLLSVRSSLSATLSSVGTVVRVLTPARISTASLSTTAKSALGGAVAGALLGLLLLIVVRRASPRIRSVSDLAALDVPVLLPVLTEPTGPGVLRQRQWRTSKTRLLAARFAATQPACALPLVVVGATPSAGSAGVAAALAASLVDRGPVLLMSDAVPGAEPLRLRALTDATAHRSAHSGAHSYDVYNGYDERNGPDGYDPVTTYEAGVAHDVPEPADGIGTSDVRDVPGLQVVPTDVRGVFAAALSGPTTASERVFPAWREPVEMARQAAAAGWIVVVDAPPLSVSDLALECADGAGATMLVVGRGSSRPSEVLGAAELFDARGVELTGAVLRALPGPVGRLVQRVSGTPVSLTRSTRAHEHALPVDSPPWQPDELFDGDRAGLDTATRELFAGHGAGEARGSSS